MQKQTVIEDEAAIGKKTNSISKHKQQIVWWALLCALVIVALAMRLYNLGIQFDHDGYDEGVYWLSLRSMSTGYTLYRQIFYSQPPFFLLSSYPFFVFFGKSLWSARLGVALLSLPGLAGMAILGKVLKGRVGALLALLLIVADPTYLAQSQTLQAEAPALALSVLAVGFAYLWGENPASISGLLLAILCGITLSLSILCKLLSVACIIPIGLLMLLHLWQTRRETGAVRNGTIRSVLAGIAASIVTFALVLLPFTEARHGLYQGVIVFHTVAAAQYAYGQQDNWQTILIWFLSFLSLAALYGTIVAFLRRDWRVIPLLIWLLTTIIMLLMQVPLFSHHLVVLVPLCWVCCVGCVWLGLGDGTEQISLSLLLQKAGKLSLPLILLVAILNGAWEIQYYNAGNQQSSDTATQQEHQVAADLQKAITPDEFVITDAQFIAGLANRNVPPALVDTSLVRLNTNFLSTQQLIQEASNTQVHAILFYSERLYKPNEPATLSFYTWVTQHFRLLHDYKQGKELWVR